MTPAGSRPRSQSPHIWGQFRLGPHLTPFHIEPKNACWKSGPDIVPQTAHSSAHPAEQADTGSDPVKTVTFVLATRMDRYGQAVRLGYDQVLIVWRTTHRECTVFWFKLASVNQERRSDLHMCTHMQS
jgi:hypothetical protein